MSIPALDATDTDPARLDQSISWWDSDADCTLVMSQPHLEPALWREYVNGAIASYHKHGVAQALDVPAMRRGDDTVLFWATLDRSGRVLGGVRAIGPLQSADESHATVEWAGQAGLPAVRKMITDRIPFGVLEFKSAWVTDEPSHSRALIRALARSGSHAMSLLDVQFCMATSAPHVLDRWRSSGGVVAGIPATPYPDERYRTKMMWWDRRTYANHSEPDQVAKMVAEVAEMNRALTRLSVAGSLRKDAM